MTTTRPFDVSVIPADPASSFPVIRIGRWGAHLTPDGARELRDQLAEALAYIGETLPPPSADWSETLELEGQPNVSFGWQGIDSVRALALQCAAARSAYGSPTPSIAIPATLELARAFEAYLRDGAE